MTLKKLTLSFRLFSVLNVWKRLNCSAAIHVATSNYVCNPFKVYLSKTHFPRCSIVPFHGMVVSNNVRILEFVIYIYCSFVGHKIIFMCSTCRNFLLCWVKFLSNVHFYNFSLEKCKVLTLNFLKSLITCDHVVLTFR